MGRPACRDVDIAWAQELLSSAHTADELRQAQAIMLPLQLGLSLEQTAFAIGRGVSATSKLRNRKRRVQANEIPAKLPKTALRNRAVTSLAQESALLDALLVDALNGGIVVIPRLKVAFETALGRKIALSTLYRMLNRHGWRKLAPDTGHPQGDPSKREAFKKNSATMWRKD
jgi:Winged helix-turn helix